LVHKITTGSRSAAQTRTARLHSADLAVVGWSATDLVARQLIGVVSLAIGLGFVTAPFMGAAYALVFAVVGAVTGLAAPVIVLRSRARAKRRSFLHAFSAYLDLVNVLLAGGAGIETALVSAADAGDGWTFDTIRTGLDRARLTRRSPWSELRALGQKWGLSDVVEVAGSMNLSGDHGAKIRSSLTARADSMRARQIAEVEALAQSATERMGLPMMMLFVGFMVFLGYPALQTVVMSM
jgi:Flp pilus assembly protein TadB